jgi:hypothetical protein
MQMVLSEGLLAGEEGLTSHLLPLPHELQIPQQHPFQWDPCSTNNGKSKIEMHLKIKIIQDNDRATHFTT